MLGPDHALVASTLGNLGRLRRRQGRYAEARPLLERALAITVAAEGPAHDSVAVRLVGIGKLLEAEGEPAQALTYYRRALDVLRAALGPITRAPCR